MKEGSLKDLSGNSVPFKPIEVSKRLMVITTNMELSPNDTLILTIDNESLMLQIRSQRVLPGRTHDFLTELMGLDADKSLEQVLPRITELKAANSQRRTEGVPIVAQDGVAVRAARFVPNSALKVNAKTFGTRVTYSMYAMNVSKSGMLLVSIDKEPLPFSVNSLLELVINPDKVTFAKDIHCSAKVARIDHAHLAASVFGETVTAAFGVQFSDLEADWLPAWRQYVEAVEEESAKLI